MFNTLEQFCKHAFRVDKQRSTTGTLKYKFVLENGVLYIQILENLDSGGNPAGGTYTRDPVSLEKILVELNGGARASKNDNAGPDVRGGAGAKRRARGRGRRGLLQQRRPARVEAEVHQVLLRLPTARVDGKVRRLLAVL